MTVQVVLVHGIRTSATMWRAQVDFLRGLGVGVTAPDLPGHGSRMSEQFTLEAAFATIDDAVRRSAERGPVLLVGHSMGGLLSCAYAGQETAPPITALIAASCTSLPRGAALAAYRAVMGTLNSLPRNGGWITERVLEATLPPETRGDFGAGGYAIGVEDSALRTLTSLDLRAALPRITIPTWFVNGQYDQLRLHEKLFTTLAPHAELIVVPRATHLVTAGHPRVFNAVLNLAIATIDAAASVTAASGAAEEALEPSP